jgi:hypothetical protein
MFSAILAFLRGRSAPPSLATWAEATLENGVRVGESTLLADDRIASDTRAALGARWRELGRSAHASVAKHAHLAIDLVALGAPPSLIVQANRNALDCVRSAELCFAVARAIDGEDATTTPRAATCLRFRNVASLAIDCARDACVPRVATKLARRAVDPTLRSVLEELGAHERRQEKHALEVLAWSAPQTDVADVALALDEACRGKSLPDDAHAGGWERWGIAGAALEKRACEAARRRVTDLLRKTNPSRGEGAEGRAA